MNAKVLSSEQHQILADYFWQRAEGELTSYHSFSHLIDDLRSLGSQASLIDIARRCQLDELKHSELCKATALQHGHECGPVQPRSTQPVVFRGATRRENHVLRLALCCFCETFGCALLKRTRESMVEGELYRWNRVHLADEVQHARFGWAFLASLKDEERTIVRDWLPVLFQWLSAVATPLTESNEHDDLVGHGYYSPLALETAHREAVQELIVPGLRHLGLVS